MFPTGGSGIKRFIFDSHMDTDVSSFNFVMKKGNGNGSSSDNVTKEVYDGFGYTYDFYFLNLFYSLQC